MPALRASATTLRRGKSSVPGKNNFIAHFENNWLVLGSWFCAGTRGHGTFDPSVDVRKGQFDAHRSDRAVDGGDPAEALWRDRTRRVLADRGAVALGHEVTLFASGDSCTSAKLEAVWPRALAARRLGPRSERAAHADAGARPAARRRLRLPAFPSRLLSVLAVLPPADAVRHDAARPARSARAPAGLRRHFRSLPVVSISNAQRRPLPQARWVRTVHHGLPEQLADAEADQAVLFRISRPHRARRRASTAPSASRSIAACRSRSPPRSTGSTASTSTSRSTR